MSITKLTPLIHGSEWPRMKEFMKLRRDRYVDLLINCSQEELKNLQGRVQELDYLLNLEQAIKREADSHRRT